MINEYYTWEGSYIGDLCDWLKDILISHGFTLVLNEDDMYFLQQNENDFYFVLEKSGSYLKWGLSQDLDGYIQSGSLGMRDYVTIRVIIKDNEDTFILFHMALSEFEPPFRCIYGRVSAKNVTNNTNEKLWLSNSEVSCNLVDIAFSSEKELIPNWFDNDPGFRRETFATLIPFTMRDGGGILYKCSDIYCGMINVSSNVKFSLNGNEYFSIFASNGGRALIVKTN